MMTALTMGAIDHGPSHWQLTVAPSWALTTVPLIMAPLIGHQGDFVDVHGEHIIQVATSPIR